MGTWINLGKVNMMGVRKYGMFAPLPHYTSSLKGHETETGTAGKDCYSSMLYYFFFYLLNIQLRAAEQMFLATISEI